MKKIKIIFLCIFVLLLLDFFFFPPINRINPPWYSSCQTNLKILATSCKMYATDNSGNYPPNLDILVKKGYLIALPVCKASSIRNSFERIIFSFTGKEPSPPYMSYVYEHYEKDGYKGFRIYCSANYHIPVIWKKVGTEYDSKSGIIESIEELK